MLCRFQIDVATKSTRLAKRRSTAALIGGPELFSNPDKASPLLAFEGVRIVNNSAGPDGDLFAEP